MNIVWQNDAATLSRDTAVPSAKLHVLGLAPLKNKLGPKWERLSGLVHKLFERAITRSQAPTDRFVVLDELSYVVTFNSMSLEETSLMCAAIAHEVCEHLFGDQIDEISVRSLVAEITAQSSLDGAHAGAQIEAMLEKHGTETVVTQSVHSGSPKPVTTVIENQKVAQTPAEEIQRAHAHFAPYGLHLGFFPVWELRRGISNTLFAMPYTKSADGRIGFGKLLSLGVPEAKIIDAEISQLNAVAAYAAGIRNAGKICAVGVGVSYDSLICFGSRIRYITALQKTSYSASSPLLIKIEQIPDGAPYGRVSELVSMLHLTNVRVLVEFQSLKPSAPIDVRLGAAGLGAALPFGLDQAGVKSVVEKLSNRALGQKAFAFLDHLDTPAQIELANQANIRFGTGAALGVRHFSGLEDIPNFPLETGELV